VFIIEPQSFIFMNSLRDTCTQGGPLYAYMPSWVPSVLTHIRAPDEPLFLPNPKQCG